MADRYDFTGAFEGKTTPTTSKASDDRFDFTGSLGAPSTPAPTPQKPPEIVAPEPSLADKVKGFFGGLMKKPVVQRLATEVKNPGSITAIPKQVGIITEELFKTDTGKKVAAFMGEHTNELPFKYMAAVEALRPDITYEQALKSWRTWAYDPKANIGKQIAVGILNSAPQSAIGVALSFVPVAGVPLSSAYWAAISADEQIKSGKPVSATKIGIDVIGDSILGASLERMLKAGGNVIVRTLKSAGIEGTTEVAQTFLKLADDFKNATSLEEKAKVIQTAKEYIKSGAIAVEFGAGAGAGGIISVGGDIINRSMTQGQKVANVQPSQKGVFPKSAVPSAVPPTQPAPTGVAPRPEEAGDPADFTGVFDATEDVDGMDIEKPVAQAVRVLNENVPTGGDMVTVSSGFHTGFSPDFNGIEPSWAVVFRPGQFTDEMRTAAEEAGLTVNEREDGHVDVYLEGVSQEDTETAKNAFDEFAQNYQSQSAEQVADKADFTGALTDDKSSRLDISKPAKESDYVTAEQGAEIAARYKGKKLSEKEIAQLSDELKGKAFYLPSGSGYDVPHYVYNVRDEDGVTVISVRTKYGASAVVHINGDTNDIASITKSAAEAHEKLKQLSVGKTTKPTTKKGKKEKEPDWMQERRDADAEYDALGLPDFSQNEVPEGPFVWKDGTIHDTEETLTMEEVRGIEGVNSSAKEAGSPVYHPVLVPGDYIVNLEYGTLMYYMPYNDEELGNMHDYDHDIGHYGDRGDFRVANFNRPDVDQGLAMLRDYRLATKEELKTAGVDESKARDPLYVPDFMMFKDGKWVIMPTKAAEIERSRNADVLVDGYKDKTVAELLKMKPKEIVAEYKAGHKNQSYEGFVWWLDAKRRDDYNFHIHDSVEEYIKSEKKSKKAKSQKEVEETMKPVVSDAEADSFNKELESLQIDFLKMLSANQTVSDFNGAMGDISALTEKYVEPLEKKIEEMQASLKGLKGKAREDVKAKIESIAGTINSMGAAIEESQIAPQEDISKYALQRAKELGSKQYDDDDNADLSSYLLDRPGIEHNWEWTLKKAVDSFITDLMEERGESGQVPVDRGTIEANGTDSQDIQSSGRGARNGVLPASVPVASDEPGDAGRVPAEPGGEAVRRTGGERGGDVGERPATPDSSAVVPTLTQQEIARMVENATRLEPTNGYIDAKSSNGIPVVPLPADVSPEALAQQYRTAGGRAAQGATGRGLLDEYYTPPQVVDLTWALAKKAVGDKRIDYLEPSAGTGNFLAREPKDLNVSSVVAYEINRTSAGIAKLRVPTATVINKPFETHFVTDRGTQLGADGEYDLVIGNPPYGEHRGKFLGLGEEPKIPKYEAYFIKRALDITDTNGVVAMVVPSGLLKSGGEAGAEWKRLVAQRGKLIEARRLPEGVFGTTEIGTDILIFRRTPNLSEKDGSNDRLEIIKRMQDMSNDAYFEEHPEHILGEVATRVNRWGKTETYVKGNAVNPTEVLKSELADDPPPQGTRLLDGRDTIINERSETEYSASSEDVQKVIDIIKSDDELKTLAVKHETTPYSQTEPGTNIRTVSRVYKKITDKLIKEHPELSKAIKKDAASAALKAIGEDEGLEATETTDTMFPPGSKKRADRIKQVKRDLIKYPDAAPEANIHELRALGVPEDEIPKPPVKAQPFTHTSTKMGKGKSLVSGTEREIELAKAMMPTGELSPEFVQNNDTTADDIYKGLDPLTREPKYYSAFNYLQGDVYQKLEDLESLKGSMPAEQYARQKRELEAIIPPPKTAAEIAVAPNSDFVEQFVLEPKPADQQYGSDVTLRSKFINWLGTLPHAVFEGQSQWNIKAYVQRQRVNEGDKDLNMKVRRERRRIGDKLFRLFLKEGLTEEEQKKVAEAFNKQFNAYARPDYAKVPLTVATHATFKGKPFELRAHQRQGVGFLVNKGVGLLAHDVGLGKTMEGIVALQEVVSRGWSKRPLIVVPNAVYQNWSNPDPKKGNLGEIQEVWPNVKVNRLANLGGKFAGDLSTMQIQDGTVSIITYEALQKMGFDNETYESLTADLMDAMQDTRKGARASAKEVEKVEQQIGRAMKGTTAERFINELGFDAVLVDEVHNFKNIFEGAKDTKGKGRANEFRNIRGSSSDRGVRMYLLTQWILKNNNFRNVFALSATPFSNSPMEIYSILSLFAKKRLQQMGISNVNEFMTMYMELVPRFVVKADRTQKEEDVVEKFKNLQQLQMLVREYIDFRTGEEVGIPRPSKDKRTVFLHPTQRQQDYLDMAQELFLDKDKGGAIVAITEQQMITLSPYLSRYYEGPIPSADQLMDDSPKIKQAILSIAQNLKDQPNGNQVLYMPRGSHLFPVVVDAIIKETGLKKSQVAIIEGGMSGDKRQSIQDEFNAGKIKVLIGSEAIKEGVNLQSTATDLHHLHLPWNPTDMIQVEGRIWRQGNAWKNVRIHYYLIENSVDPFIFQKLETKEKRIKNIWSYKGDEVEVGDLDFENMKMDLITDPMMRVQAERQFTEAQIDATIKQQEAEYAFINRKMERLLAQRELVADNEEYYEDIKKRYAESQETNPDIIARFERNLSYQKERTDNARAELEKMEKEQRVGSDTQAQAKSEELLASIATLKKDKEEMEERFKVKEAMAKEERRAVTLQENDYSEYTKKLHGEASGFYQKVADQKTPSGQATVRDIGSVPQFSTEATTANPVRPIELPELVMLAQDVMGKMPKVVPKLGRSGAVGMFRGAEGVGPVDIRILSSLFKSDNAQEAAIVLGHEFGHLVDFLPENTMKRGNIRERLLLLRNEMYQLFGKDHVTVTGIRDELKELTRWWNPFDEESATDSYRKYRYSSKELYAEAISVLLNAPHELETRAPHFFKAWFETIEKKPEVAEAYYGIQEMLSDPEKVQEARLERLHAGYEKGNQAQLSAIAKRKAKAYSLWLNLRMLFDDVYAPITRLIRKRERAGEVINADENPRYILDELPFKDNENFMLMETIQEQIREPLTQAGFTDKDIGDYLFFNRVMTGRKDVANPLGFTPKAAREQLERMASRYSPEQMKLLEDKIMLFHDIAFESVQRAVKNGVYNKETFEEKILPNRYTYAAFGVVDYLNETMPAGVKKQVGTFKEIANPFLTTIMKTIALNRANALQEAKVITLNDLQKHYPGDVSRAKAVKRADGSVERYIAEKDRGLYYIFENGRLVAYNVDPYIAESMDRDSIWNIERLNGIIRSLTKPNRLFKALFTTYNPGFVAFNTLRDLSGNYLLITKPKGIPDATLFNLFAFKRNVLVQFLRSLPEAAKYSRGELTPFVKMLVDIKGIRAPFGDLNYDPSDSEIDRLMQKYHVGAEYMKPGWEQKFHGKLLKPLTLLLDAMRFVSNTVEVAGKIGGARVRVELGESGRELAYNLRNFTSTPNAFRRGMLTESSNNILLYSNIMKEGLKQHYLIAADPKTASGYWWKTAKIALLPKLLMLLAAYGLFGKWLEDFYSKVTEYDKTNYIIIPLGLKDGKAMYLRIPHTEGSRLIAGMFWKLGGYGQNTDKSYLTDMLSYGVGQLPGLTPTLRIPMTWADYLQGKNPVDSFRGRNIIDDTTYKAGGFAAMKKMVQWTINQFGLTRIATYDTSTNTGLETFLQLTPLFSSLIKLTDYGETERYNKAKGAEVQEEARDQLRKRDLESDALRKIHEGMAPREAAREAALEWMGHAPRNPKEKQSFDAYVKRILEKSAGKESPAMESLRTATTKDQQKAVIAEARSVMTEEEFSEFRFSALKNNLVEADVFIITQ